MSIETTKYEKENLEAHVELCAYRYQTLENRLTAIEKKVEGIHEDIQKGNRSISTVIVSSTGTIIAGIIGLVITIIMKF